jgi:asparagine synthetase B (glutamine-hydrolysing)
MSTLSFNDAFEAAVRDKPGHRGLPKEICQEALYFYFIHGYVPWPLTIYAGHTLDTCTNNPALSDVRDWGRLASACCVRNHGNLSESDIVGVVEAALRDAISETASQGSTLLLSSGLDSASIAAVSPWRLNCVTIVFPDHQQNEDAEARHIAEALGHAHAVVVVNRTKFREYLPEYVRKLDQPYAHPNGLPTFIAFKESNLIGRDGYLIDGTGGDILFGEVGQGRRRSVRAKVKRCVRDWRFNLFEKPPFEVDPENLLRKRPARSQAEAALIFDNWPACLRQRLCTSWQLRDDLFPPAAAKALPTFDVNRDENYCSYYRYWSWHQGDCAMMGSLA